MAKFIKYQGQVYERVDSKAPTNTQDASSKAEFLSIAKTSVESYIKALEQRGVKLKAISNSFSAKTLDKFSIIYVLSGKRVGFKSKEESRAYNIGRDKLVSLATKSKYFSSKDVFFGTSGFADGQSINQKVQIMLNVDNLTE